MRITNITSIPSCQINIPAIRNNLTDQCYDHSYNAIIDYRGIKVIKQLLRDKEMNSVRDDDASMSIHDQFIVTDIHRLFRSLILGLFLKMVFTKGCLTISSSVKSTNPIPGFPLSAFTQGCRPEAEPISD